MVDEIKPGDSWRISQEGTAPIQVIHSTPPSKSNSYRIILIGSKDKKHGSLTKTEALRKYEDSFYMQCNKYRNANIEGRFKLEISVFYPNDRSDLDGCLKVVLDCLQKVRAFANDNKCAEIVAKKFIDKERPRIEFSLQKLI